jgi:hypothetical protein
MLENYYDINKKDKFEGDDLKKVVVIFVGKKDTYFFRLESNDQ